MKSRKTLLLVSIASAAVLATTLVCAKEGGLFTGSLNAEGCRHTHVEHHAGIEPTLIRGGQKEYWCCCECHTSFANQQLTDVIPNTGGNPTDLDDGRHLDALGVSYDGNPTTGSVSTELVPSNTVFDTVYYASTSGQFVLDNLYIGELEELAFAVKSSCWHIYNGSWDTSSGPNEWYAYKLVNNGGSWDIYRTEADLSTFTLRVSGKSGNNLQDIFELDGNSGDYYITNIRYIAGGEITGNEIADFSALEFPTDATGEVTTPFGYEKVTKQVLTNATDYNNFGSQFLAKLDIAQFSKVQFRFMTTNRQFCNSSWSVDVKTNVWNYAEVINNLDGTYTSRIYDENHVYKFGYENMNSFRDSIRYANYGGDIPTWYSTEVIGELRSDLRNPTGELLVESAMCSNGVTYQNLPYAAPEGFEKVNKLSRPGERVESKNYFCDITGTKFALLTFAIRCDGYMLFDTWTAYNDKQTWTVVEVIPENNGTFSVYFKTTSGSVLYSETNLDCSAKQDVGFVPNALNQIMFIAATYVSAATDNFFVTELRAVRPELNSIKLEDSAICSNGIEYTTASLPAPVGFTKVNKVSVNGERADSKYYSQIIVSDYDMVTFAIRADFASGGYLLLDGWRLSYDKANWVIIEIIPVDDYTYDITFKTTDDRVIATRNYTYNELAGEGYVLGGLNNLIFKCDIWASLPTDTFYITDLRAYEVVEPVFTTELIDECAISANGVSTTQLSETAPEGFATVHQVNIDPSSSSMHGMFFSNVNLLDYAEVYFAAKTSGKWYFDGENIVNKGGEWVFFSLFNNGDNTFDLIVKDKDGNNIYTRDSMNSYRGADPGVYTNYALNAILYGNADVNPQKNGDIDFTVFATELRGIQGGTLEIVGNSSTNYNIVVENNRYISKASDLLSNNLKVSSSLANISVVPTSTEVFTPTTKSISIGNTSLLRSSGVLNGVALNGGYIIKTVNESIFVYAENMSDYIIAVNHLMEIMFDYKYYAADEISMNNNVNVTFPKMSKIYNPSFVNKERIADASMLDQDEAANLGFTAGYEWEYTGQPHAMCDRYLNYATNKSAHPNWYSEGKDRWGATQHQLCYSAHGSSTEYQAMVDATVNDIIREVNDNIWIFENSNIPTFTIDLSIQDNWYQCNCSSCQAELVQYGSYAGQQLHFVNDVANKMDVWFQTNRANIKHSYKLLAYQQGQKAPASINYTLNKNIEIQFAPVYLDISKPLAPSGVNSEHYNDLLNWVNLFNYCDNVSAENISVWYYAYSTHNIVPIYDYDAFQESYKNIKKLGIKKIANQFITNGSQLSCFQDLNLFLKAKVMENVNVNLDEITRDFIDHYYGSGSEKIYEFFQTMNTNMKNTYTGDNTVFETHDSKTYWSKTVVNKLIGLCDEAISAVQANETDAARKQLLINRINREKCTPVYMAIEYRYVSLFDRSDYKDFFEETCTLFGITHINSSTTVEQWL